MNSNSVELTSKLPKISTMQAHSPAPGSRRSNNRPKLFQCTGFGDCNMVFTRSEHLARHARKHTGEKPFQCIVPNCNRMFSRFDNMMQHTQTHSHRFGKPPMNLISQTNESRRLHPYHPVNDPHLTMSLSNEPMDVRQLKRIRETPYYTALQDVQTWQPSRSEQCWSPRIPSSPVSPGHPPPPLTISTSRPSQYFPDLSSWQNRMPISPVSPVHPADLSDPQCIPLPFGPCNINATAHTSTIFPRLTPFPTASHDILPFPTHLHAQNPENICVGTVSQLPLSLPPAMLSHSLQSYSLNSTAASSGSTTAVSGSSTLVIGAKATRRLSIADLCNPIAALQHDITIPATEDEVLNLAEAARLTEDEVEALKGFSKFHCFPVYNPSMDSMIHFGRNNEVKDDKHDDGNETLNNPQQPAMALYEMESTDNSQVPLKPPCAQAF
ncbi:hypothetical protein BC937DRAFT_93404 [Endogone sp. FLAS-F59071]|nr:hypothetical protein BC937DRAFT_93404 [Endogone sp. FLAS-F59071]|eukprot:RUS14740.1 hypothetical protein BC937DRAFT_93404 [Endogone sp. FLAS-F59071]